VKVSFYLQKNKNTLVELAQDIEKTKMTIAQENGKLDETTGQYAIDPDKIETVSQELNDLFNLEQEVNIYTIDINSLSEDLLISTA
jgi:predicted  nucleic acid-binding Zn-ribbon protein